MTAKLFFECINKDGMTGLGSESYRYGPFRSQPRRQNRKATAAEIRRQSGDNKETAAEGMAPSPKMADNESDDIVRASKGDIFLDIMKIEPDQRLIFGWASIVEKDGAAIVDKQGDIIPIKELENAAYEFTLNSRNGGDMHSRPNLAKLVESAVFTEDKQKALGVDLGFVGWWVGFKVHDDELWAAHKRGERPEFSIGGQAIPIEIGES